MHIDITNIKNQKKVNYSSRLVYGMYEWVLYQAPEAHPAHGFLGAP